MSEHRKVEPPPQKKNKSERDEPKRSREENINKKMWGRVKRENRIR